MRKFSHTQIRVTEQSKLIRFAQSTSFREERSLEKQVKLSNLSIPLKSSADSWLLLHTNETRFRQSDRFRLVRLFPSHEKVWSSFIPVKSSCESWLLLSTANNFKCFVCDKSSFFSPAAGSNNVSILLSFGNKSVRNGRPKPTATYFNSLFSLRSYSSTRVCKASKCF